ncbi:MAG: SDR family NAD(P)-dependent oxidoreductase [Thermoclostridium sp.]|nr:SDR family NAD(P)-dependent oxidoreductase [Thermoclostridium sp.]
MHRYGLLEHILFPPVFLSKEKLRRKLAGKTIVITGASSGIGASLACALAGYPVHLVLIARSQDKLHSIKDEIEKQNARVSFFCADLRNRDEMAKLIDFLKQLPEKPDFFISNAGKSIRRSIHESLDRFHDFTRTMAVNYFAPVELLLSLIPLLCEKRGKVINISSTSVLLLPIPRWSAYLASKTAFDVWLRSITPEIRSLGISTSSIYFPLVKTSMILPTKEYQKMPAMSPEHAARIIIRAMTTNRRIFRPWWLFFGQVASVLFRRLHETFTCLSEKRREQRNV